MKTVATIMYACEKCNAKFNSKEQCEEHEKRHGEILFMKPVYGEFFVGAKEINAYYKINEKYYKVNYKYAGLNDISKEDMKLLAKLHLNSLYGKQVTKIED